MTVWDGAVSPFVRGQLYLRAWLFLQRENGRGGFWIRTLPDGRTTSASYFVEEENILKSCGIIITNRFLRGRNLVLVLVLCWC